MIDKSKAVSLFGNLYTYNQFRIEWAFACYKLNPNKKNKKKFEDLILGKDKNVQKGEK